MEIKKQQILSEFHAKLGNIIVDTLVGKVTPEEVDEFYGCRAGDTIIGNLFRKAEQIQQLVIKAKTG